MLQVQIKPVAKRMQIDVPLHKDTDNYNSHADASLQLDSIQLSSSAVDMRTSYAVASIMCAASLASPSPMLELPVEHLLDCNGCSYVLIETLFDMHKHGTSSCIFNVMA